MDDDELDQQEENGRYRLADAQIEQISTILRAGRPLPPYLFPHLFETPREYELAYGGKARAADVLAETMAVPLQAAKRFAGAAEAWTNKLILGDNLQVLKHLLELKQAGELINADGTPGPRLAYLDPPFATGEAWETRAGRVAYVDRVKGAEFIEWLRRRLILLCELLADDGSIVLHLDQRYAHYMKIVLDELLPGNFRNEIIVPRGVKGVQSQFEAIDALSQGHYSLLLYSKRASTRYRKLYDEGQKPSRWDTFWLGTDRPTMRYDLFGITPKKGQWRWSQTEARTALANYEEYQRSAPEMDIEEYADLVESKTGSRPRFLRKGAEGQPQWYRYAKTRRLASDVWDVKTKGSVTGYPTEKHEDLLDRLISWLTEEGDLVIDPFAGSGTTVAVAEKTQRRWIAVDSSKLAVYSTLARLLRQREEGDPAAHTFTLFNAGLYEYQELRGLPWLQYKEFVLHLFQCRRADQTIAGVAFDGYLGDDLVLVYDFNKHEGATIGLDFVEDLARLCGKRLTSRVFIIAPALAVEPYEDYLDVADIRFFFLRIPYSIISELHRRAFSELRQPHSLEEANSTIDSVGFDFIQPPRVETSYERADDNLVIKILEFESEAYAARPSEEDIADLAMLMIDQDYEADVFDLDAVYYAEDLARDSWTVSLPVNEVGKQMMVIFIDVYGNEHRETKMLDDFRITGMRPVALRARPAARPKGKVKEGGRVAQARASTGKSRSARSKTNRPKRASRRSK